MQWLSSKWFWSYILRVWCCHAQSVCVVSIVCFDSVAQSSYRESNWKSKSYTSSRRHPVHKVYEVIKKVSMCKKRFIGCDVNTLNFHINKTDGRNSVTWAKWTQTRRRSPQLAEGKSTGFWICYKWCPGTVKLIRQDERLSEIGLRPLGLSLRETGISSDV